MSFTYNGSRIINHLLECDIPYFGLISIPVFKSRLKRHQQFMQSKSRSGDEDWLQCNHDIFSDIIEDTVFCECDWKLSELVFGFG